MPGNKEPLIAIASDKEATGSDVERHLQAAGREDEDGRRLPARSHGATVPRRCSTTASRRSPRSRTRRSSAPTRRRATSSAARRDAFTLGAGVKDGAIERGLEALLVEAKRVDEFGFLQSELDRAKQNMIRGYERAYAERDKTQSSAFVQEYINNYLNGEAIPGIDYEYKIVQQLVPTITLADVNKLASNWITDDNRVIIARVAGEGRREDSDAAGAAGGVRPRQQDAGRRRTPRTCRATRCVARAPAPATSSSSKSIPNGQRHRVEVVERRARPREADRLQGGRSAVRRVRALGGTSLASDADYMSAALASQIVGLSGIGNFNAHRSAERSWPGKVAASAGCDHATTSEGLSGRASPKDLETMFQLIYLDFTAPRLDPAAYQALQGTGRSVSGEPRRRSGRGVRRHGQRGRWRSTRSARVRSRRQTFAEVNPEKALAFYKDRFADASDFTFVVRRQRGHGHAQAARREVSGVAAVDRAQGDVQGQRRRAAEGRRRKRRAQGRRAEGEHDHRVHRRVSVRSGRRGSRCAR